MATLKDIFDADIQRRHARQTETHYSQQPSEIAVTFDDEQRSAIGDGEQSLVDKPSSTTESVAPSLQAVVVLCAIVGGLGLLNSILTIVVLSRIPDGCVVPQ